jgi:hypothetical protein
VSMGYVLIYVSCDDIFVPFLGPFLKLMYSESLRYIYCMFLRGFSMAHQSSSIEDQGNFSRQFHPFRGT